MQVTAVQGATASAFMTEPAWGIAQSLTVHARAGVRLSGAAENSSELLCRMMGRAAILAKQEVSS